MGLAMVEVVNFLCDKSTARVSNDFAEFMSGVCDNRLWALHLEIDSIYMYMYTCVRLSIVYIW